MVLTESRPAEWNRAQRIAFRFFFAYFALYFFPLPSGLASPDALSGIFDPLWQKVVPWVASRVFHVTITTFSNGSGDTTFDYFRILCMAMMALLATGIWSLLDRRKEYTALHGWARIWFRYALALSMLTYGVVKVIKLQFPSPGYLVLNETYGESSPMRLLWTFMGFSTGYTFFAGAGEMLGGVLLFFRRTTLLGLLVILGVMSNVVMLNFCYDVPVKLGSSHLLLLTLFLLAPELRRLADFFLFNRTPAPADPGPRLEGLWLRRAAVALQVVVVGGSLAYHFWGAIREFAPYGPGGSLKAPDGYYEVAPQSPGAEPVLLRPGGSRWKLFELMPGYARIWGEDRTPRVFTIRGNPASGAFTLRALDAGGDPLPGAAPAATLRLQVGPDGKGSLSGTFEGKALEIALARKESSAYPLMKRGFHWISEFPYNR